MKKIITISREYGSGGRYIGGLLAEKLGYKFYDKELIDLAAKESGLAPEFVVKAEQNLSSGWFYNLMLGSSYSGGTYSSLQTTGPQMLPLTDQLFNAQRKTIIEIAKKGPCVIVGRCADYILKSTEEVDSTNVLNVFIYADEKTKIDRAVKMYNVPESEAKKVISQINKRRANHYNTFTEDTWGKPANYDIMVNSSAAAPELAVEIISLLAKASEN